MGGRLLLASHEVIYEECVFAMMFDDFMGLNG